VLADPVNTYITGYEQSIVNEVNGTRIKTLRDLADAFAAPSDLYVITLEGEGRPIVLESAKVEEARERIRQRYRIPQEIYLGEP
jgi:hypothetical protein